MVAEPPVFVQRILQMGSIDVTSVMKYTQNLFRTITSHIRMTYYALGAFNNLCNLFLKEE